MIKLFSCLIPSKHLRHLFRQFFFTFQVRRTAKFIGENFICGNYSTVNKNTVIKNNVYFRELNIIGNGEVYIENYFHCGFSVLIISDNHNYQGAKLPYDETFISKKTEIADFVWIGARVIILGGTTIGEGAIVQAGSVVHGQIPAYSIVGGNPAVIIRYRNLKHFYKIKHKMLND